MQLKAMRTTKIRKFKKEKRELGLKPSSIKKNVFETKCESFLSDLIRKRPPKDLCPHFLVGSSSFLSFLQGSFTFNRAHSFMNTSADARIVGMAGEVAFKQIYRNIIHIHPFGISSKNPWVASSTDFVYEEVSIFAAEIKTFRSSEKCASFYSHIPLQSITQVWLQLETLELSSCKLMVFRLDEVGKKVSFYGQIVINRKTTLFDEDIWILSSLRYSGFLKEYFNRQELFPSQDYISKLAFRLANRFDSKDSELIDKSNNKLPKIVKRTLSFDCQFYDTSTKGENQEKTEFRQFEGMFDSFKFSLFCSKEREIDLNNDLRSDIFQAAWKKMTIAEKENFAKLKTQLNSHPKNDRFISKTEQKRVQEIDEKGKLNLNKVKGSMATVYKGKWLEEKEKRKEVEAQNKQLKKKLQKLEQTIRKLGLDHKMNGKETKERSKKQTLGQTQHRKQKSHTSCIKGQQSSKKEA